MTELAEMNLRQCKSFRTSCSNCNHRSSNEVAKMKCKKFGGADVPIDVASVGCDDWEYDEIPF